MAKQTNWRKDSFTGDRIMFKYTFKLQEMFSNLLSKFFEWSFQRQANKMFEKND